MKLILLLVIILGFAAYFLPARLEVAAAPCAALETRAGRLIDGEMAKLPAKAQAARPTVALGPLIGETVSRRLPGVPPEIACAVAYWFTVFQPDVTMLLPGLALPRG